MYILYITYSIHGSNGTCIYMYMYMYIYTCLLNLAKIGRD